MTRRHLEMRQDLEKVVKIEGRKFKISDLIMCEKCSSVLYLVRQVQKEKVGHRPAQYLYTELKLVEGGCCGKSEFIYRFKYFTPNLKDLQKHWPKARYALFSN